MPKISIPIKTGYPAESVITMAETLGKLTGTAVECQEILEITANESVIKALVAIAPMAKRKRKKGEPILEGDSPTAKDESTGGES